MPDGSRPTLTEVAARARVSTATVSRVLNGRPGVAEGTRQRVARLLGEVGYSTGDAAGSALVGLVTPRLEDDTAGLVQAVQAALGAADVAPVLCVHHETGGLAWAVDTVLRRRVAGVIALGPVRLSEQDVAALLRVEAAGLPLVLVDVAVELGTATVGTDVAEGIARAVRHLTAMGHERLGLLAGPFTDRMVHAFGAVAPTGAVEVAQPSMASAVAAAETLLDAGVTAVLGATDVLAVSVLRAAAARGLAVPVDLSVVAGADSALALYADPSLDALRVPATRIAQAGVDALLVGMDRVRAGGPRTAGTNGRTSPTDDGAAPLLFSPELIVRASSTALSR